MIERPLRSTDEGKVKLDLAGLIRNISVLFSLSFNVLHSSRILVESCMIEWQTLSWKVQRRVLPGRADCR